MSNSHGKTDRRVVKRSRIVTVRPKYSGLSPSGMVFIKTPVTDDFSLEGLDD